MAMSFFCIEFLLLIEFDQGKQCGLTALPLMFEKSWGILAKAWSTQQGRRGFKKTSRDGLLRSCNRRLDCAVHDLKLIQKN
jgi:hypothetical protein